MGDIMETLDKAEKMLCKGIDEINQKGELNASSLEMLGSATDALKDIYSVRERWKAALMSVICPVIWTMGMAQGDATAEGVT